MRIQVYLHASKDAMLTAGEEAGLSGTALDHFVYALHEVAITLDVNPDTGAAKILAVDGRPLEAAEGQEPGSG